MCALSLDGCIGIVADDLTGALDAGAAFATRGHSTYVSLEGGKPLDGYRVAAVNMSTRLLGADEVSKRVAGEAATSELDVAMVKSDSAMRGHFGLEAEIVARLTGASVVLVCPAFPANGRTVRDGVVYVDGVRLDQTDVGRDTLTPIVSGSVRETILQNAGVDAVEVSLADVRAGKLAKAVGASSGSGPVIVTPDAETDDDLDLVVRAAAESGERALLCGSAGLAAALARFIGEPSTPNRRRHVPSGPVLVITASQREATARQVEALMGDRGFTYGELMYTIEGREVSGNYALKGREDRLFDARLDRIFKVGLWGRAAENPAAHAETVFRELRTDLGHLIQAGPPGTLVLVGGDTAENVLVALGARGIVLDSEPLPGVALGVIDGGAWDGVAVATKSGAFGDRDTLVKLYDHVTGRDAGE